MIAGQIRGLNGRPARGVRVVVASVWNGPDGIRSTEQLTGATDNQGRFRFTKVFPGRYFIQAGRMDTPTYFPGTANATDAGVLTIRPDSRVEGVDFQLVVHPGATVSGRVTVDWRGETRRTIVLSRAEPVFLRQDADVGPDGAFTFRGIPPGSYTLSAASALFWNNSPIVVTNKDITGIRRKSSPFVPVRGSVEVEGGAPLPGIAIEIRSAAGDSRVRMGWGLEEEAAYIALPVGLDFRVSLRDFPVEYRVESFTYGDTDLLKNAARIEGVVRRFALKVSIAQPSRLRRIHGHVKGIENLPFALASHVTLSGFDLLQMRLTAPILNDGSFAFSDLRAGKYSLFVGNRHRATVEVADRDINDMEVVVPVIRQVKGRVVVAGGGPVPRFDVEFDKVPEVGESTASRTPGTFEALLPEGDVQMKFYGFPDAYQVQSITFGDADALQEPLRIIGSNLPEIVVTLRVTKPALRVTGRILDLAERPNAGSLNLRVTLHTPGQVVSMQTTAAADGSFAFSEVPPGIYTVTSAYSTPAQIIVEDQDVHDVELARASVQKPVAPRIIDATSPVEAADIGMPDAKWGRVRGRITGSVDPMPATVVLSWGLASFSAVVNPGGQFEFPRVPSGLYAIENIPNIEQRIVVTPGKSVPIDISIPPLRQVRGRVVVEGGEPLPRARLWVDTEFRQWPRATDTRSDGAFDLTLHEGEHTIRVRPLGGPYRVKSIRYGSADLLYQKLTVAAENPEIVVTMEVSRSVPWARVSGRFMGAATLPSSAKALLIGKIDTLFIESTIEAGGTFAFSKVPPGTYTLRTEPRVFGMVERTIVVEQDVEAMDLVVPDQRPLTVRVHVEGGGKRPGLSFSLIHNDGKGFRFLFPQPLSSPLIVQRTDFECISDVCTTPGVGKLLNEPVILPDASTPETFTIMLPEGEYRLEIDGQPGQVLSLTQGERNLQKETLKVTGTNSTEVLITLGSGR